LGHSLSRALKPTTKKALPEEKLSLNDDCEIKANEKNWFVKMNVQGQTKQVERLLVVGPYQLRLLIPDTFEEVGKFPYKRMKEFSHNISYKMFQFSWYPTSNEEETFYFHTSKCVQIQAALSIAIKDLLKEQKIDNPEAILQKCTYRRAPQVERMKVGGRQRSVQNSKSKTKPKDKPTTDLQTLEKKALTTKSLPPEKLKQLNRTPVKRSAPKKEKEDVKEEVLEETDSESSADSAVESV